LGGGRPGGAKGGGGLQKKRATSNVKAKRHPAPSKALVGEKEVLRRKKAGGGREERWKGTLGGVQRAIWRGRELALCSGTAKKEGVFGSMDRRMDGGTGEGGRGAP